MVLWYLHFSSVQIKTGGITVVNVDEVYKLNKKINELKKQLDEAKKELKANGVGDYTGDKYIACVKDRVKETFNADKCVDIIKKNKLNWLLKETVDCVSF